MANRTDTQSVINLVINGKQAMTSLKELTDTQRKLNAELRNMKPSDPGYEKQLKQLQMINKALDEQKKAVKGITNETSKLANGWQDIAKGVVAGLGISFGIESIKNLGMQVFETTAKFQKLEAVLTTTLGSKSSAQLAMAQIQDFAARTPFQVDELTASYVKLANQGFKPTMEQLRQLGDLSSSTGKGFDQLTEAIIDAQTGEFERLKEFGIRAEKNGDKVRFAFKGISTEVDFTSDAIRNYITNLGDAEGISGSMAGISDTLAGKVSNLSDNWDSLLKTVGDETSGVFSGAIDIMGDAITKINTYLKDLNLAQKYNTSETGIFSRVSGAFSASRGGIDVGAVKRSAFSSVSNNLDQQIGSASSFQRVNEIITDLNGRMRKLDRTTQDGAATYQLYADKLKMVKDRATEIATDRVRDKNIKASDAAKLAAKEQEKLDAAAKKKKEKDENQAARDYKKLQEDLAKNAVEVYQNSLSKNDKEVADVQEKYLKLRDRAKGNKDFLLQIQQQEGAEMLNLMKKQADDEIELQKKKEEEAKKLKEENFKKEVDNAKNIFDQQKNGLNENYGNDLSGVSTEEQAALLKESYQQRERNATEEHLLALKMLYEAYGQDATEIDNQLADARLASAEREAQGKIAYTEAKKEIDAAYLDLAQQGTSALIGLVGKQTMAYKAFLVLDKAMAIAKVIINTQAAIAGYRAANSALGVFGAPITAAQIAAAKISAGVSIGIIAATGIKELAGGDAHAEGVMGATAGKKLVGEAGNEIIEKDGKWWLTDGPQIVDFKGGENVYNANETSKMLSKSMYAPVSYSLNTTGARDAEMSYRRNSTATAAPNATTASSNNTSNNSQMSDLMGMVAALTNQIQRVDQKPVVFDFNTYEDEQKKIDWARNQQSG